MGMLALKSPSATNARTSQARPAPVHAAVTAAFAHGAPLKPKTFFTVTGDLQNHGHVHESCRIARIRFDPAQEPPPDSLKIALLIGCLD